ncbi:hypothetical protein UFOVP315_21 [uncultured Caudovirales phage]|uniref:Uncharacterized protein n=1 Tax=uncultured Caudovirales phage TaxID=2100421 RepID=A0A6J5LV59_9CAUD|nr:hypothetical protein UFOVP315_21 [uncultured Caudovirales phage]
MINKVWAKHLQKNGHVGFSGRPHKYGAVATTTHDGIKHASKGQADRWDFLKNAEGMGLIKNLRREIPFKLEINGVNVCIYRADHVYELAGDFAVEARRKGQPLCVVEDYKGTVTPEARLKMRLYEALHGWPVKVVKTPRAGLGWL